jgi:hypothetical protein
MEDDGNDGSAAPRRSWHSRLPRLRWIVLGAAALHVLIQFIPYGHDYSNPPVKSTPNWTSAKVEHLAAVACADCHSNTTEWPKKARIAPASWLIRRDVDEGRSRLNWSVPCGETDDIGEAVRGGGMPPLQYKLVHANARLSDAEKAVLAKGLPASLGSMPECKGGD